MKYFCEAKTKYKIVCAGSILGVQLSKMESSFPVGKVYRQYMYSMDFEEYLWAINEHEFADIIENHYKNNLAIVDAIHQKALKRYKEYLYVGGMPSSLNEFIRVNLDLNKYDNSILNSIVEDYIVDMNRYTTNTEANKIRKLYASIPKQLGKENSRFQYKLVDKNGSKRYFETAIEWLVNSYTVQKCRFISRPEIPFIRYSNESKFKVYASDVGILSRLSNLTKKDLYLDNISIFRGLLTENYVANMLKCNGFDLYCWVSDYSAEIDFVINIDGDVIPVEVKAANNTKSKSLKVYVEKYNPKYSIKISSNNFAFNNIKSVPLYAAHLIK